MDELYDCEERILAERSALRLRGLVPGKRRSELPQPVEVEPAKPVAKVKPLTIDQRLVLLLQKLEGDPGWSAAKFKVCLGCKSDSGIKESPTWKALQKSREEERQARSERLDRPMKKILNRHN